jgi:tetratricopeptide (TPR) repeat protein
MKRALAFAALFLAAAVLLWQPTQHAAAPDNAPRYTQAGKLVKPANYREWIYLSSGLGMNYRPAQNGGQAAGMFTNVFVNPESYRAFLQTGKWPDKTTFALEVYSPATHSAPNQQGLFQDSLMAVEAEVKDSSTPEVWRYYDFGAAANEAQALPQADCFACHEKSAAVEHSFVQFYPQLLEVALAKGVIKPGVEIPLNLARFEKLIVEKGWEAAEAAYRADRKQHEHSLLDQRALNSLAYQLEQNNRLQDGLAVAELVTRDYPSSANAWDTLSEGYETAGRKEDAMRAARKALETLPADQALSDDVKQRLEKIEKERISRLTPAP